MVAAIVLAHLWGVVQLFLLGSPARTVRLRTLLLALAAGLYLAAPVAVLLQIAWIRPFAALTAIPLRDVVTTASYTVDPVYANPIEALWEFGLPDDPVDGAPDPDTIRATLRDLVAEGLVRLYGNEEVYGDPWPVPEEEQLAVLDDPSNWRLFQEGERGVRFTTTPAGDEAVGHRPPGVPPYPA